MREKKWENCNIIPSVLHGTSSITPALLSMMDSVGASILVSCILQIEKGAGSDKADLVEDVKERRLHVLPKTARDRCWSDIGDEDEKQSIILKFEVVFLEDAAISIISFAEFELK